MEIGRDLKVGMKAKIKAIIPQQFLGQDKETPTVATQGASGRKSTGMAPTNRDDAAVEARNLAAFSAALDLDESFRH